MDKGPVEILKEESISSLPCEEAKSDDTFTLEDWRRLMLDKDNALKVAEDTQNKMRTQLNQQVEMYNRDMNYMTEMHSNMVKYTRTKEDAIKKVLEGVTTLMEIDRMPIAPEIKEGN